MSDVLLKQFDAIQNQLRSVNPIVLSAAVCISTYSITNLWHMHRDEFGMRSDLQYHRDTQCIRRRLKTKLFSIIKSIPSVRAQINSQLSEVNEELSNTLVYEGDDGNFIDSIPNHGISKDRIVELATIYDQMEGPKYLEGRVSGAVFSDESDRDEMEAYAEIFKKFAWSNPLWPKLFPGVRKMESEVVRMCCNLMNGDENTCGTMSTGGSISILLACLAHRNRLLKRGEKYPEMILPSSAHAAFFKAAEVFRIKIRKIPVDPVTFKVDLRKMKNAINKRTCMLIGSAPNFPFGTIDDIEEIARMGIKYDIPVHVDACLGGFILPFIEHDIKFDFRVPGVSSISADTHKYGLAPKGSSVVLYRNLDLLHNQYFCDSDWQGGIYASATLEGSRSGTNIALCWTALLYHGQEEYTRHATKIVETTRKIRDGISKIRGIKLQGSSDICIVSWTTDDGIDIFRFHNQMKERQWQLSGLQFPAGVHLMVTMNHTRDGLAEKLIEDCENAVKFVRENPPSPSEKNCEAAIYGMAQGIPDRSLVSEFAYTYLDACYSNTR